MNPTATRLGPPSPLADLDAIGAATVDGLRIEYVQLEAQPFSGSWTVLPLGGLAVLQFGNASVAVMRRILVPSDRWLFMVPLVMPAEARWNGSAVIGGELMICAPGARAYAFDPSCAEVAFISVASGAIADLVRLLGPPTSALPGWSRLVRPRPEPFHRLCANLFRLKAASGTRSKRSVRGDEDDLRRLADALVAAVSSAARTYASVRCEIVRKAEDFFRQHLGEPLSIARLSSSVGVSERSLRNAFYDVSTTSPKRYFRIWQLNQVRRALRASTSHDATVTDVATGYGFFELGRFAGEYKALFGEAPSKTLHRSTPLPQA